ncbi:glycoside hydrolase family 38 N-terminal domain-containing protein [Streptomyces rubiginosohelvolus]|uniref:Glycoside hydrolase family 38 central domain-containing protein n=1 Tax=Streptomyces rubiginosohelvolus TaxID=67362 RepID=A0ABW6F7Y1_9ACTN
MSTTIPSGPAPASDPEDPAPRTGTAPECHVVTHVHWDREWYRPFEAFRARLVELASRVCAELDDGRMTSFHLDGQTIVLADVEALRPDLAERLREHARAGRLTLGPWHVLADNQLVSGESLIRNLLTARRWAPGAGTLAGVGYSPDAFGHPADLPRLLRGFGMDTALVWRGAPDGVARFRWRSPDGSEVFAVNQGYHGAEVLWADDAGASTAAERLKAFLATEHARLPEGPWLLMNGGDHLAPSGPGARIREAADGAAATGAALRESTLEEFFGAARAAADARTAHGDPLPVVEGELREPAGYLTFILPGTLSARTHLKQANAAAQNLLERWAEPALALHAPHDPTLRADLDHAWELLLRNAPHDSLCGCSVDEVHRENAVRFERVHQLGEHVVSRALLAAGLDVRVYGDPAHDHTDLAVLNPHPDSAGGPVEAEILTAPGRHPVAITAPGGRPVPFETETLGIETAFEADLDLLPDSRPALRHRLFLNAPSVPGLGRTVLRVQLGDTTADDTTARADDGAATIPAPGGGRLSAADDASLTLTRADGTVLPGLGLLTDGGDSGDTYNYDPPLNDTVITPRLVASRSRTSAVRTVLELDAVLDLPVEIAPDRKSRSERTTAVPVRIEVAHWHGDPLLRWQISLDNTARDHRLRFHAPTLRGEDTWTGDGQWSLIERPVRPDLGPLPTERGHEAVCGSAPVQGIGAVGRGTERTAIIAPGLPEMRALAATETATGADQEIVVTLLRCVGWLSRFDLRSRTTGAGPMLETPEAQCQGPRTFDLAIALGEPVATDIGLFRQAADFRTPLRAWQLRPGTTAQPEPGTIRVDGALLAALKPAENRDGFILRLANPTPESCAARVHAPAGTLLTPVRLDEEPTGQEAVRHGATQSDWPLAPFTTLTLRIGERS